LAAKRLCGTKAWLALPPRSAGAAVSDPRPVPGPFGYGGFWPRVAARLIDAAFVAFLGGLAHWLIGSMIGGLFTSLPYVDLMIPEINGLVDMVLFVVYAEIFVHWFDATPGKMALGLKILRSDGEKLGRGRSLAREWLVGVSFALLGIGALMVAFDPERRSLHDRICDTRVIRSR